jgi:hypothetical protein
MLPLFSFAPPAGGGAASVADELSLLGEFPHQNANPIAADAGAGSFDIDESKLAFLGVDCIGDQFRLRAARRCHRADAALEFIARILQRVKDEVDVGPGIASASAYAPSTATC